MKKYGFIQLMTATFIFIGACGSMQNEKSRIVNDVAVVKIDSLHYNLGAIPILNDYTINYKLTNESDIPLKIIYVKTSCGCTKVHYDKKSFEKGETTTISVIFNTDSPGEFERYINVYANIKEGPLELSFSGIGIKTHGLKSKSNSNY